jgi:Domain of unknown function (DUF4157)
MADRDHAAESGRAPGNDAPRRAAAPGQEAGAAAAAGSAPATAAAPAVGRSPDVTSLGALQVRAKSAVAAATDPAEREADRAADKVLRMAAPEQNRPTAVDPTVAEASSRGPGPATSVPAEIQRSPAGPAAPAPVPGSAAGAPVAANGALPATPIRRQAVADHDPHGELALPATTERYLNESQGTGSPLLDGARRYFEARFSTDFRAVRVHDDDPADQAARSLGALAFTRGRDIWFSAGAYDPVTDDGRRVLAHELAHVAQQNPDIGRLDEASSRAAAGSAPVSDPTHVASPHGQTVTPPGHPPGVEGDDHPSAAGPATTATSVQAPSTPVIQRRPDERAAIQTALAHRLNVQRLRLQEGPPLAPGNYLYGDKIISLDAGVMRQFLTDMAVSDGLTAEAQWQEAFAADMRSQSANPHSYEDPVGKQTVVVETALANRADQAQQAVDGQVHAVQQQFQQQLLGSVGAILDRSELQVQAEGRRYGFPDDESILQPKPVSAGAAALGPALPGAKDLNHLMTAARTLLTAKRKLAKARQDIAKLGPFLGEVMRPTVLEPALLEYYQVRAKQCGEFPILASVDRDEARLAELASGADAGDTGPAAAGALLHTRELIRKELADKLSNIAVVRTSLGDPGQADKFWLDQQLRENTKRTLGILPKTLADVAVEERVKNLKDDAQFYATLKEVIGIGLLILSFVPGAGLVAGAVGAVMAAADVIGAFQEYYWQEAAAGTAFDKAEAISQSDPSLFGLALSIAYGLLEGVAEAKALEGAITVFREVRAAYREARAAAAIAKLGSGAAKGAGVADFLAAREKLRTTADRASGRPGLGEKILADLPADVRAFTADLEKAIQQIKDPELQGLVRNSSKPVAQDGTTLAELAARDPAQLEADFAAWKESGRKQPFEDYLTQSRAAHAHQIVSFPDGLVEEGLDAAGARRSYEASLAEDPEREVGIWKDPATGEYVCVQGGPEFVPTAWMGKPENLRGGKVARWDLVMHHHPGRGLMIDALPSGGDFDTLTHWQRATGVPKSIRSVLTYIDPESKLRFQTEFGFEPGAKRPYWARYRVDDGTVRVASFENPPWAEGAAEYQAFIDGFKGDASAPVPGANIQPAPEPGYVPPTSIPGSSGLPGAPAAPKIVKEDIDDGPHGPNRPIIDVVARMNLRVGGDRQGRWLSAPMAEAALANLDDAKMVPGRAYSVPIPPGAGVVVRPAQVTDPSIPVSQQYVLDPADRALVVKRADGQIHTYPIGPDNRAYSVPAPMLPPATP